jgi:cytochrome b
MQNDSRTMKTRESAIDIVRVWDLPTRLFHWALVVCVCALFASAYAPGNWIDWHARLGYAVLALVVFRLAWGLLGGYWSRFVRFLPRPGRLWRYLRGMAHPDDQLGHNPMGGLMIYVMLAMLLAQVGTGLVSDDEIAFTGPLNRFVSSATGLAATAWHKDLGQWILVALVALHVLAVLYYRMVRRTDLLGPMLHGDKRAPAPGESWMASRDDAVARMLGLVVFGGSAALVMLLLKVANQG